VIASLPELTEAADLVRIAALASIGPAAGLHLIVAGWPPPPLTPESTQAPLASCTQITLRNPYAWVGDPPRACFGAAPRIGGRLNSPAYLDPDPPTELVRRVCAELAARPPAMPQPVTTTAPAWSDYLVAARHLDAVRQAPADEIVNAARAELAVLVHRLAQQRPRLVRAGAAVAPEPADLHAAGQAMTGPEAIRTALASARGAVDRADAVLATESEPIRPLTPESSRTPAAPRLPRALVYGGFALLTVVAATLILSALLLLG
jgi:hypothetical protein